VTREQFETTFLEVYEEVVGYATKRLPDEGRDMVHQAYANIVSNETYLSGPYRYRRMWVFFKVGREIARFINAQQVRQGYDPRQEG